MKQAVQLRRASKSISANIIEGYGRRRYKADFIRFLIVAHASYDETIEWTKYVAECHKQHAIEARKLLERLDTLGRKINRFIASVDAKHKTST